MLHLYCNNSSITRYLKKISQDISNPTLAQNLKPVLKIFFHNLFSLNPNSLLVLLLSAIEPETFFVFILKNYIFWMSANLHTLLNIHVFIECTLVFWIGLIIQTVTEKRALENKEDFYRYSVNFFSSWSNNYSPIITFSTLFL